VFFLFVSSWYELFRPGAVQVMNNITATPQAHYGM